MFYCNECGAHKESESMVRAVLVGGVPTLTLEDGPYRFCTVACFSHFAKRTVKSPLVWKLVVRSGLWARGFLGSAGLVIGSGLVLFAIAILLLHFAYVLQGKTGSGLQEIWLSLLSVGLAFLAFWVADQSDRKMQRTAEYQFYEKLAILGKCLPVSSQQYVPESVMEAIVADIDAALMIERWVTDGAVCQLSAVVLSLSREAQRIRRRHEGSTGVVYVDRLLSDLAERRKLDRFISDLNERTKLLNEKLEVRWRHNLIRHPRRK